MLIQPDTRATGEIPTAQMAPAVPKIVSVNTADLGGGAERIAMTLHRGYRERGWESWLVVGDKRTDDPHVVPFYSSPHIDYRPYAEPEYQREIAARRARANAEGWYDWEHPYSHRLGDVTQTPPDVVHLHNLHGGYFDLRAAVEISRRWPTFLTLHDYWWFTGHCAYPLGCQRWRSGCGKCGLLHVPPEAKLRDATRRNWQSKAALVRQCRFYIASATQQMIDLARSSLLAPAIVDARVIPYGIDLNVFRPASQVEARQQLGIPLDAFVLMFAGKSVRSNPFKDYETICKATASLRLERKVWLLAVGEAGDEESHGQTVVRHVPFIDSPQHMALHFQAADVYLHAAHNEVFGLVIAEALACGVPVVATAVDGIPEVFNDGEHGLLVPRRDAPAMAQAVVRLSADHALRRSLAAAAVQQAQRRYAGQNMIERHLDWYQEVLASTHKQKTGQATSQAA
jgi:glycosyltransferase involved in cell wall biosynthesis